MTEHLDVRALTGFAARLRLAIHVRSQPLEHHEDTALRVLSGQADELRERDELHLQPALDYFVTKHVDEAIEKYCARDASKLAAWLKDVKQAFADSTCNACMGDDRAHWCARGSTTFTQISNNGLCIKPVKDICEGILLWLGSRLQRLPAPRAVPRITLATTHRGFEGGPKIIEEFAIGGWARADAAAATPVTVVGIEVREDSFDWQQYCLLPYVLLHEILCHGLQSLDGHGTRLNAPSNCAWSEGWMDRLAFNLAREWIASQADLHAISTERQHLSASAAMLELHNARYVPAVASQGPAFGRDVFDDVRACYGKPHAARPMSQHPITNLSLLLNAATLDVAERLAILKQLQAVSATNPPRLQRICAGFIATGDLAGFRKVLQA